MDGRVLESGWGKVGLFRNVGNYQFPKRLSGKLLTTKINKLPYNRPWKEFEDWPVNSKTSFKNF
jgi:hypothetical protein